VLHHVGLGPSRGLGLHPNSVLCSMKTISKNNQKVSNGNQDVTGRWRF
jgi:hypothetical protein